MWGRERYRDGGEDISEERYNVLVMKNQVMNTFAIDTRQIDDSVI